jgi:hypothetical protein
MHRWISTDNGSQCFRCGVVLGYAHPSSECEDADCDALGHGIANSEAAHALVPPCAGPGEVGAETPRAHHFWFGGDRLECAYGDAVVLPDTDFASIAPACVGA